MAASRAPRCSCQSRIRPPRPAPALFTHLATRGTGKSGWHTTEPDPTAVASIPASVTSALSPARARLAALPSTSIALHGEEAWEKRRFQQLDDVCSRAGQAHTFLMLQVKRRMLT
jgi:hypothetical protein